MGASRQPEDVHQRRLAAARRPHDRHVFAALDPQRDATQRVHPHLTDGVDTGDSLHADDGVAAGVHQGAPRKPPGGPPPPRNARKTAPAREAAAFAEATRPFSRPAAAVISGSTTVLPALRPLRTCVVSSPSARWRRALHFPAVFEHGHAAAARPGADRFARHADGVLDLFDHHFGARRHPGPQALGALGEGIVAGYSTTPLLEPSLGRTSTSVTLPASSVLSIELTETVRWLTDLELADVGLAEGDFHLQPLELARTMKAEEEPECGADRGAGADGQAADATRRPSGARASRRCAELSPETVSPTEPETEAIVPEIGARSAVSLTSWRALLTLSRAWRRFASAVATLSRRRRGEPDSFARRSIRS